MLSFALGIQGQSSETASDNTVLPHSKGQEALAIDGHSQESRLHYRYNTPYNINIERSTQIAFGTVNRFDTYLSPLEYEGTDVRFISDVLRVSKGKRWDWQLTHDGGIDISHNRADNANALAGHYDFAVATMYRWNMADNKLTLRLGGMANANLGFAYNMHNSANNPAQGYASVSIGGAGMATYKLRIGKHEFPITYQARLPLAGIMFSPAYGQSYYELFYEGNSDNNIVFNGINTPSFRQQLSIGVNIGRGRFITFGYLGDIRQATPNNLKQHIYTNDFFIGVKTLVR